jgi:glycerate 2-kinase
VENNDGYSVVDDDNDDDGVGGSSRENKINQKKSIIRNKKYLFKKHNYKSVIDSLNALEFAFYNASPDKIVKEKTICLNSHFLIKDINNHNKIFYLDDKSSVYVISVGKASVKMLKSILEIFKEKVKNAILIMPKGQTLDHNYFEKKFLEKERILIIKSSHPIPDNNSLEASEKVIQLLSQTKGDDVIIFLISGGASSLLVSPIGNLTLDDKKTVNKLLINCGANIKEINIVRKHLSKIKGGNMLRYINNECCIISLILSDVVGDYLDTIGSGLTTFDESTFLDAKYVLEKYLLLNLDDYTMEKVRKIIHLGTRYLIPETLKPKEFFERDVNNFIIGNNYEFCGFLIRYLKKKGYNVLYLGSGYDKHLPEFIDDSKEIVKKYLKENSCILMGGEITNTVNKNNVGRGGRNQEALCLLLDFFCNYNPNDYSIIFIGTDGIDGNTTAAGGLISPTTIEFLKRNKIEINRYTARHDSYNLLLQLYSNIFTGYTGTNFNDIYLYIRK